MARRRLTSSPSARFSGSRLGRMTASTEQASAAARSPAEVGVISDTRIRLRALTPSDTRATGYQAGESRAASSPRRPSKASSGASNGGKSLSSGSHRPTHQIATPRPRPVITPLRLAPGQYSRASRPGRHWAMPTTATSPSRVSSVLASTAWANSQPARMMAPIKPRLSQRSQR